MGTVEAGLNAAGKVADVVGKVIDRKNAQDDRKETKDDKQERVEKIMDAHDPGVQSVLARWGYAVRLRLSRGVPNAGATEDR